MKAETKLAIKETPAVPEGRRKAVVFISYAREDEAFVRRLTRGLTKHGVSVRGDWQLTPGVRYAEQLVSAIDAADAFLFVISPDSVTSEACREEIEQAVKNNKRLAPVVRAGVADESVHGELRQIQYVFFREQDDFDASLRRLVRSIKTDLAWVKAHSYWLQRALDWQGKGKAPGTLLRGSDLREAEQWLAVASTDAAKDPRPTRLQSEYVAASRAEELREERERAELMEARLTAEQEARSEAEKRVEEQRRAARRLRRRAALLAAAFLLAVGAAMFAFYQLNVADARRSAALALSIMGTGYDRALLLSARAYEEHPDTETLGSLLTAMQKNPRLVRYLRGHTGTTWALVFSPDGATLASGHGDGTIMLWDAAGFEPLGPPLEAHTGAVKSIAFSPDGKSLYSGGTGGKLFAWNLDPTTWVELARAIASRDLTQKEMK